MKKTRNNYHCEGLVYQHKLELKTAGPKAKTPGVEYIQGSIQIATDDECTNIVEVYYPYVTALTSAKKENSTYLVLANLINGTFGTVMGVGKEKALKVRVDTQIALNDWYSDKTGQDELVSVKRNEGGFIHTTGPWATDEAGRNQFDVDMVITGFRRQEADPERDLPEKGIVKGCIFNDFRKTMLPVEFSMLDPKGMDYFESLEVSSSNPVFTRVKGQEISETIVRKIVEESAFGEPSVREVKNSRKDYVITWTPKDAYLWDDESTITADELKQMIADREVYLAEKKADRENWKANKGNGVSFTSEEPVPTPAPAAKSSATTFDF